MVGGKRLLRRGRGNADGLALALAGTGVGARALAADREAAEVAETAVALDRLEALQVLGDVAAEVAFALIAHADDVLDDLVELLLGEVLRPHGGIEAEGLADLGGPAGADTVDVAEGDLYFLVVGNVYAEDSRHGVRAVWKVGKRSELEGSEGIGKQKMRG